MTMPLLWIIRARNRGAPFVSVSTLRVGAQIAPPNVRNSTLVAASAEHSCKSKSWIAAFFIEGFGPRPTGPITLYYVTEGKGHRLENKSRTAHTSQ
jgi:hypothetical protein